jgi:predicted nucleotidyltransferase
MSSPVPLSPQHDAILQRAITRIRHEYPDVRAILLKGSAVRGDAGPASDLDLDVLVDGEALTDGIYAAWFDSGGPDPESPDSESRESDRRRLHHVSLAIEPWDAWWESTHEPVEWAMGLPAREVCRVLWVRDPDDASAFPADGILHPAGDPELEDFISDLGKVQNAFLRGDDLGVRMAAQMTARLCPTVLTILNPAHPAKPVTSVRAALDAVLEFPIAPQGYRDDLLCCFGLSDASSSLQALVNACERLVFGTIALLEDHLPPLGASDEPRFEIGLDTALANRTLRAYVHQIHLSTPNQQ